MCRSNCDCPHSEKEVLKLSGGRLDEPTKVKLAKHIAERFNRRENIGENQDVLWI